jgi:cysteine desulfurase / selenocysteine lyase
VPESGDGSNVDRVTTPIDRSAVPATERWIYLDHAGIAPLPLRVTEAMCGWARGIGARGSVEFDEQNDRMEEVRRLAALLMGVDSSDVAFVKNTTEGLGFVANGLEWAEGDRVVVPDGEFPSTIYPWLSLEDRGVVIDRVGPEEVSGALPLESFARVIEAGPPPKVVVTSWVQYSRGWRTDLAALAELAHGAGALLCADVIQGLGLLPAFFDAWGVDFAVADAHKWLLGPAGIGVLYVRRSCLDLLRPLEPGWASVDHRQQWENLNLVFDDCARRLEGGSANACGIYGLGAALELILDADVIQVWRHVHELCRYATEALGSSGCRVISDTSEQGASGIVTFEPPNGVEPEPATAALKEAGVVCSARGGGIRISPHGYNTPEDIDGLLHPLQEMKG